MCLLRGILLILILLFGKLEGKEFAVERYDNGDAFVHWSDDKGCGHFGGYPADSIRPNADCNTTLGCCCEYGDTFYTFSGNCERLQDENSKVKGGNYRFDRSGLPIDTSVSTMQGYFIQDSEQLFHCMLVSTTANKMLPVIFKGAVYSLGSCNVTDIYIVHYCEPRKLPQVTAKLEQNPDDEKYYLRLESIPPEIISKFYGELLQVAINCSECGADNLFFKFAGKTILNQNKTFLNEVIPEYDPVHHPNISNCSTDVPTPESNSATNDAMIYIIIGPLTVCIILVMILTGYYYKCERRRRQRNNEEQRQRLLPEGEESLGAVQPQPQPPGAQPQPNLLIPAPPIPVTYSIEESVESSTTRSTRSTRSSKTSSQSTTVHLLTSQAPQNV